jgi:hypothetical protein
VIYFGQTCAVPSVRFRTLLQAHSSRKTNAQTLLRLHGWHKNFCVSQVALKQSEPCAQLRAVPSVLFEPLSENSFWPRVGTLDASLLRDTDGRAPKAKQMGQPGRPLSGVGERAGQNFPVVVPNGVSSCVHRKGFLPSRLMKCGATDCNAVQWIAPTRRRCQCAPLAASGRKRPPRIGRITRASSPAWQNIGWLGTRFQTRGAWRLSVCSHSPRHSATSPLSQTQRSADIVAKQGSGAG